MPGADLTPARLEALLAAATPGPWTQHLVDETLVVSGSHQIATTNIDATYDADCVRMAADAELLALSPALAARVIELEGEVERLREAAGAYRNAVKNLLLFASHGDAIAASATLRSYADVVGDEIAPTALETPNAK